MISDSMLLAESISDLEWFQENAEEYREKYEGEFVAIKDKTVIEFAPSTDILLRKLKDKGIDSSEVLIEYISPRNHIIIL